LNREEVRSLRAGSGLLHLLAWESLQSEIQREETTFSVDGVGIAPFDDVVRFP
jgi:hypothetical protein